MLCVNGPPHAWVDPDMFSIGTSPTSELNADIFQEVVLNDDDYLLGFGTCGEIAVAAGCQHNQRNDEILYGPAQAPW